MMKEPAEHLSIFLIVTFYILQPCVCRQALDLTVLDRHVRLEQLYLGLQVQPCSFCSLVAPMCLFLMSQHQPSCSLSLESEARLWPDGPAASLSPGSLHEVAAIPFLGLQPWAFCSSELCLPPTIPRFPSLLNTVLWGFILSCTGFGVILNYIGISGSSKEFHQMDWARCAQASSGLSYTVFSARVSLPEPPHSPPLSKSWGFPYTFDAWDRISYGLLSAPRVLLFILLFALITWDFRLVNIHVYFPCTVTLGAF